MSEERVLLFHGDGGQRMAELQGCHPERLATPSEARVRVMRGIITCTRHPEQSREAISPCILASLEARIAPEGIL